MTNTPNERMADHALGQGSRGLLGRPWCLNTIGMCVSGESANMLQESGISRRRKIHIIIATTEAILLRFSIWYWGTVNGGERSDRL